MVIEDIVAILIIVVPALFFLIKGYPPPFGDKAKWINYSISFGGVGLICTVIVVIFLGFQGYSFLPLLEIIGFGIGMSIAMAIGMYVSLWETGWIIKLFKGDNDDVEDDR